MSRPPWLQPEAPVLPRWVHAVISAVLFAAILVALYVGFRVVQAVLLIPDVLRALERTCS